MYTRAMAIGVIFILYASEASADRLEVAAKGKKQAAQKLYGTISSFDGTAVIFEVNVPPRDAKEAAQDILLEHQNTRPESITVKDNEIVVALDIRDPQAVVETLNPLFSEPRGAEKDVRKLEAAAQKKKTAKSEEVPAEIDLTLCSGRGVDQIVEADPGSKGATKVPVQGELNSIAGGFATLRRASDGATLRYRLDALTEIRIGICR